MTEVELKLVANNKDAVQGVRELSQQTQKLYTDMGNNSKMAVGLIEKEEQVLKQLTEWKKKANADQIANYNKEIELSKKRLDQYNKIGTEVQQTSQQVEKSGTSFINSIKGWAMGFASVTAAIGFIKEGIKSTEEGFETFEQVMGYAKGAYQGFWSSVMTGDWAGLIGNIKKTAEATKQLTAATQELEHIQNSDEIKKGFAERRLQAAREEAATTTDAKLKKELYSDAIAAQQEITSITIKGVNRRIGVQDEFFKSQIDSNEKWKNYSIETFRTIAGQYDYLFAKIDSQGKPRVDLTGQEAAELQLKQLEDRKILLGKLTTSEENQRKELKNSVLAMRDFIEISGKLKPDQFEAWVKDVGLLNMVIAEGDKSLIRLNRQMLGADSKDNSAQNKAAGEYVKTEEEKLKLVKDLIDKFDKTEIESLTGVAKLEAQRDFGIKQIKELRDQLAKLGEITPEQMSMLQGLADNVWQAYYDELRKLSKNTPPQIIQVDLELKDQKEKLKKLQDELDNYPVVQGEIDLNYEALKTQVEQAKEKIKTLESDKVVIQVQYETQISTALLGAKQIPGLAGAPKMPDKPTKPAETIWDLMGIDTETDEGKQIVDAAKQTAEQLKGVMDDIMQRRTEDAQKRRELLDTQISEKQEELNRETDLLKNGYANNVDLKKKELDALKVQRDKAIQDEQKALQQQIIIESITQTISLATSIAQIFKANSKAGTVGIILAIASVAAMIAAFASAKSKVTNATKLAEGGTGTVEGLTHSEGGEKFLDHIEVEAGERWGVLSRGASQKYGNQFKDLVTAFNRDDKKMIFTTFNKLNPELAKRPVNILNVENSGPNKRLDKVNENLEKMNTKKEQVFHTDKAIIIVRGNHVTTIRR